MNLGSRLRLGAVAVGVILLIAGCTSSTADAPATSPATSPTVSPSVIDPSSLAPSSSITSSSEPSAIEPSVAPSLDAAAQEAADRAAIEAQWIGFWDVYRDMIQIPDDQREITLSRVATSPLKEQMIEQARNARSSGQDNYGTIKHQIFWDIPVNGQAVATVADCQDQTGTGVVEVSSGKKLTEGVNGVEVRGQMVRGEDGVWRVQALFESGSSNC